MSSLLQPRQVTVELLLCKSYPSEHNPASKASSRLGSFPQRKWGQGLVSHGGGVDARNGLDFTKPPHE